MKITLVAATGNDGAGDAPQKVWPVLPEKGPDGRDVVIPVELLDIVPGTGGNPERGNTWPTLEFTFKVKGVPDTLLGTHGDLVGRKIWGKTSANFTSHPDNRLRQWVQALLGFDLDEGFELDTEMLIGRIARGVVGNYKSNKYGTRHEIKALLPLVSTGPAVLSGSNGAGSSTPAPTGPPASVWDAAPQASLDDAPF